MAHLFIEDRAARAWRVAPLHDLAHAAASGAAIVSGGEPAAASSGACVCAVAGLWVLLGAESVRVNGLPLWGGVRVLRDRDELLVEGQRAFFAEEEPPRVLPFPGAVGQVECPRCARALAAGELAAQCACGLWYHSAPEWPCFTYAPRCTACDRPTALDGGYRWSPECL